MTIVGITGPNPEPDHPREADRETETLRRNLNSLRRTWKIPVAVGIFALVLLTAAMIILRMVVPTTTTYLARFEFVFPGVASGVYPSGLQFSINEIIEPDILSSIYDRYHLEQYNVNRDEFYHSFSIRPYTPTEDEIAARYRLELADRRLTFTERQRLEDQFKASIDEATRNAAEVTFTLHRRLGIPDEIGRSIVEAVPARWSQRAIEDKGVLQIPGGATSNTVISPDALDRSPLPVALLMLIEADERFSSRMAELKKTPGITSIRDSKSGITLVDIEHEAVDLELLHINVLHEMLLRYRFNEGTRYGSVHRGKTCTESLNTFSPRPRSRRQLSATPFRHMSMRWSD